MPDRLTFAKQQRVVHGSDFTRVIREGAVAADATLVVFVKPNIGLPQTLSRMGVTIPKRTGNAVLRNLWKRRIREAFRHQQSEFPNGYDIVIRPKKGATNSWSAIDRSLNKLIPKAIGRHQDSSS